MECSLLPTAFPDGCNNVILYLVGQLSLYVFSLKALQNRVYHRWKLVWQHVTCSLAHRKSSVPWAAWLPSEQSDSTGCSLVSENIATLFICLPHLWSLNTHYFLQIIFKSCSHENLLDNLQAYPGLVCSVTIRFNYTIYIYTYIYIHTHTHMYTCYIYMQYIVFQASVDRKTISLVFKSA